MTKINELSKSQLENLFKKYLVDHSSRRFNFLYWNISDPKDQLLNFVNLAGKELNRVNNSELVYRLIKVKNNDEYTILADFINKYIVDPENSKAVYVIRIDYLLSYLKSIKYDFDQVVITRELFGTGYCNAGDLTKKKPICTVDDDIQSLYLINRLCTKYRKFISQNDIPNAIITDILDSYKNDVDFKYIVKNDEIHVVVPIADSLDIVSKKFLLTYNENVRLEQIYLSEGLSTVISKFVCSDMTIINVRVYLQLILKQFVRTKRG